MAKASSVKDNKHASVCGVNRLCLVFSPGFVLLLSSTVFNKDDHSCLGGLQNIIVKNNSSDSY